MSDFLAGDPSACTIDGVIPLEEMQRRVLDQVDRLESPSETVPLEACDGRVTEGDVTARNGYPLFDNSSMDGYAVRRSQLASLPAELRVVGLSAAGQPTSVTVGDGEAARILTGAMMVDGADTVVPVEDTEMSGPDTVLIHAAPEKGAFVRRAGEVIGQGSVVLEDGTLLNPGHMGLLAGLGISEVTVERRPRAALLVTGHELRDPSATDLAPGQIFDTNNVVLTRMLERLGCQVDVTHCDDEVEALVESLSALGQVNDLIVSSGGVSMGGEFDALRVAAERFDVETVQVAIKPAKPFAFGRVGGALMFGLPGNPASALISFESFVRPALRRMTGVEPAVPEPLSGVLGQTVSRREDDKAHFVPMRRGYDDRWAATGALVSHSLATLAEAEAMLLVPAGVSEVAEGTRVDLIRLWT